jgi:hypothetical protein
LVELSIGAVQLVSEGGDGESVEEEATGEIVVVAKSFVVVDSEVDELDGTITVVIFVLSDVMTVATTVNSLVGIGETDVVLEITAEVAGMLSLVDVLSLVGAVVSEEDSENVMVSRINSIGEVSTE